MKKNVEKNFLFLFTIIASGAAACLYHRGITDIAGIILMVTAGCASVWFGIEKSSQEGNFLFDNGDHFEKFVVMYVISLLGSLLFPVFPVGGWPYPVIFIGLMLFSNQLTGLSAGSLFLMISVMLQGGSASTFFIYFIGGLAGITIFSYIDQTFIIWLPLLVSLLVQMVCLFIQEILFADEALHIQMFITPVINIFVCLILLLALLKFLGDSVIHHKQNIYMGINDPESPLLVELKAFSSDEYYHAVHTAYLCDRIAKGLELDDAVAKACGYYHRIGKIRGENSWENVSNILAENNLPVEVQAILKEYIDENEKIISKETVVLLICDEVVSSITYLFSQDAQAQIDYQKIIAAIFMNKLESGIIDYSRMTIGELQEIKQILMEEQLYYDFLR